MSDETNNMASAIESTMREIDEQDAPTTNKRETLKQEISDLESNIKHAQDASDTAEAEAYSHNPISPEQANETKRSIVFMKKDLEEKRDEFKRMDS